MAYRGIGNPQIRIVAGDGTLIEFLDLPRPVKGGRKEEWENLTETYENIDGEIIAGVPTFRFKAEYTFGLVQSYDKGDLTGIAGGFIDKMSELYNDRATFNLVPHSDAKYINYDVIIEDLSLPHYSGLVKYTSAKIDFVGVRHVKAIPTIDNMLGVVYFNRIFGVDDSN